MKVAIVSFYGSNVSESPDLGRIINDSHFKRVKNLLKDHGGKVITGGEVDASTKFVAPTIISNPSQDSLLMSDECFGPVLAVLPFDGESSAIEHANDSAFGLASSVWTTDVSRALRVSHQLEVGVTWINDHLPIASEAPHGGVKGSGFGKDMSQESLTEYSVTRHIMIKHAETIANDSFRPA